MAVSHEVALRDELLRSRDHDIATLTIALREARAEIERLRAALKPFAELADRKEYTLNDIDHGWCINAKLAMRGIRVVHGIAVEQSAQGTE